MEQKNRSGTFLFYVFLAIPIAVNAWKLLGRHYTLYEIWPHLLLDLAVIALFFFVIMKNPLESPIVYGALWIWFSVAFFNANPPESVIAWIASIVVIIGFAVLGMRMLIFFPYVALGLLLGYYGVLRTYLPELNRDEVIEVLNGKSAPDTARGFVDTLLGYERNVIGREKYRYFFDPKDSLVPHLRKAGDLHEAVHARLKTQGVYDIAFREMRALPVSEDRIRLFSEATPCSLIEEDEYGLHKPCRARVMPFEVSVKKMDDGSYRIADFPEELDFTIIRADGGQ